MMADVAALALTVWRKQVPTWAKYALSLAGLMYAREAYKQLNEKDLSGSVVLITGGGNGIGKLMAKKLASRGCSIIIWDVAERAAADTVAEITAAGGIAKAYVVDITNSEAVMSVAQQCVADMGAEVDILINNAGRWLCEYTYLSEMIHAKCRHCARQKFA
jgi:lactate dehydrogenase-like 2-hydroxyacid dehydrogenase